MGIDNSQGFVSGGPEPSPLVRSGLVGTAIAAAVSAGASRHVAGAVAAAAVRAVLDLPAAAATGAPASPTVATATADVSASVARKATTVALAMEAQRLVAEASQAQLHSTGTAYSVARSLVSPPTAAAVRRLGRAANIAKHMPLGDGGALDTRAIAAANQDLARLRHELEVVTDRGPSSAVPAPGGPPLPPGAPGAARQRSLEEFGFTLLHGAESVMTPPPVDSFWLGDTRDASSQTCSAFGSSQFLFPGSGSSSLALVKAAEKAALDEGRGELATALNGIVAAHSGRWSNAVDVSFAGDGATIDGSTAADRPCVTDCTDGDDPYLAAGGADDSPLQVEEDATASRGHPKGLAFSPAAPARVPAVDSPRAAAVEARGGADHGGGACALGEVGVTPGSIGIIRDEAPLVLGSSAPFLAAEGGGTGEPTGDAVGGTTTEATSFALTPEVVAAPHQEFDAEPKYVTERDLGKVLFIGGLPRNIDMATLKGIFGEHGMVVHGKLLNTSRYSGRAAILELDTQKEATWAVDNMNGMIPPGLTKPIVVKYKAVSRVAGNPPLSTKHCDGEPSHAVRPGSAAAEGGASSSSAPTLPGPAAECPRSLYARLQNELNDVTMQLAHYDFALCDPEWVASLTRDEVASIEELRQQLKARGRQIFEEMRPVGALLTASGHDA